MSKFNWRNGFTFGLITGGCAVIILVLFSQAIYDLAKCNHNENCERYAAQHEGEDFPSSWWWVWDGGLVSAKDSLAQWIMAFFTIGAVILVWQTLVATQKMVRETKTIGDQQITASNHAILVAQEANKVAAQQFRAGFKPWISVELQGPFIDMTGGNPMRQFAEGETERVVPINAKTFIHCIGDIPVTIEDFELRFAKGIDWPYVRNHSHRLGSAIVDFFAIIPRKSTIQIDPVLGITNDAMSFSSVILTSENLSNFIMRPPPIIGKVIYSDPMGVRYEHRFAFVANPTWGNDFKRYGGTAYNGECEIKEGDQDTKTSLGAFDT